ncbi:MAG TPA: hypothetical protein VG225_03955 [Terracidiphilus sp.]|nr:hypothetical protein [Terracidiphilus sp.]
MIPSLAIVRVQSEHFWCPTLPVPLFLLWIVLLLFSPLILLALVVLWAVCLGAGYPLGRAIAAVWRTLCALPGIDVRVTAEGKHITVRIL